MLCYLVDGGLLDKFLEAAVYGCMAHRLVMNAFDLAGSSAVGDMDRKASQWKTLSPSPSNDHKQGWEGPAPLGQAVRPFCPSFVISPDALLLSLGLVGL